MAGLNINTTLTEIEIESKQNFNTQIVSGSRMPSYF